MAIDLEIWWLRSLSFIVIIPLLGSHLVSIRKMVTETFFSGCLGFFSKIIAIVMIGYGVASRSMVYYPVANSFTTATTGGTIDTSFDGRSVFHQILYPVYYMMYGQIDNELATLNSNSNVGWAIATYVLFSIHMILINILLTNMLIAIFSCSSKRLDEVYDDMQNIWRSQQYTLIREYYTRAPFFPAINLIYDMYHLCRMLFFFIRQNVFDQSAHYEAQVFQIIPEKESIIKDWCEFEENSTYEYAHNEVKILKNTSTKSTPQTDTKNKELQETIADIKDNTNNTVEGLKKTEDDLSNLNIIIHKMRAQLIEKITNLK